MLLVVKSAYHFRWCSLDPRAKGHHFSASVPLHFRQEPTSFSLPNKHSLPMGASLFWASFSSSAFLVWAQFFHTSSPSSGFREFGSRSSGEDCGCDWGSTSATWTVWAYERETMEVFCIMPFGKTARNMLLIDHWIKTSPSALLSCFQRPLNALLLTPGSIFWCNTSQPALLLNLWFENTDNWALPWGSFF